MKKQESPLENNNIIVPSKFNQQDLEFFAQYKMDVIAKLEDPLSKDFVTTIDEMCPT